MKLNIKTIKKAIVMLLLCICTCTMIACVDTPSKQIWKNIGEDISCKDISINVASVYYALPIVDTDLETDNLMVVLTVKNNTSALLDFEPSKYFSLKNGAKEYQMQAVAFNSIKTYIQPNSSINGQMAFKISASSKEEYTLEFNCNDEAYFIKLDLSTERIQSKCVEASYSLNENVRIDQLEVKLSAVEVVSRNNGAQGKKYVKASIDIKSVSAGAPSLITSNQFKLFSSSYKTGKIVEKSVVGSLPTNESTSGHFIYEVENECNSFILVVSRHITGEDAVGFSISL